MHILSKPILNFIIANLNNWVWLYGEFQLHPKYYYIATIMTKIHLIQQFDEVKPVKMPSILYINA